MENTTEKYAVVDYCYQDFNNIELQNTNFLESIKKAHNPIVTIIHHTDMDGICAAQIMKEFCERCLNIYKIDLVAYNYQKNFNFNSKINPNSNYIIVVDLSLKFKEWHSIFFNYEAYRKGLWLDHHIASIRDIYEHEEHFKVLPIEKYIDINGCGTMISYELTKGFYTDEKFRTFGKLFNERTVFLTDCYDRWLQTKDKYFADCLNRYLYSSDQLFVDSDIVKGVLLEGPNNILSKALIDGNTFLQLEIEKNKFRFSKFHKDITLYTPDGKDYKACVLWGSGNSQIFGDNIDNYDVVIRANYNAEEQEYYFSFYTVKDGVDCSNIAKQYGGGGHLRSSAASTTYNILNKKWKC